MGHLQENKDNLHSNNSCICKKAVCLHLNNWKTFISHMKLLKLDNEMIKYLMKEVLFNTVIVLWLGVQNYHVYYLFFVTTPKP